MTLMLLLETALVLGQQSRVGRRKNPGPFEESSLLL